MNPIIECVPNISEGCDPAVIKRLTDEIAAVAGVKLLMVDPGRATHRTVVTFVGELRAVLELSEHLFCLDAFTFQCHLGRVVEPVPWRIHADHERGWAITRLSMSRLSCMVAVA